MICIPSGVLQRKTLKTTAAFGAIFWHYFPFYQQEKIIFLLQVCLRGGDWRSPPHLPTSPPPNLSTFPSPPLKLGALVAEYFEENKFS